MQTEKNCGNTERYCGITKGDCSSTERYQSMLKNTSVYFSTATVFFSIDKKNPIFCILVLVLSSKVSQSLLPATYKK